LASLRTNVRVHRAGSKGDERAGALHGGSEPECDDSDRLPAEEVPLLPRAGSQYAPAKKTQGTSPHTQINPNTGFLEQLRNYAEQLGLKNDFKQIHLTPRKEHSLAKQKRLLSAPKDKNTPKLIEQPSISDSLREKLSEITHKPDIIPILYQKSQELRRGKS
jgi:hypothetical protein